MSKATTEVVKTTPIQQAIQNFKYQIGLYEKQVLPDLLDKHGKSPSQLVQILLRKELITF